MRSFTKCSLFTRQIITLTPNFISLSLFNLLVFTLKILETGHIWTCFLWPPRLCTVQFQGLALTETVSTATLNTACMECSISKYPLSFLQAELYKVIICKFVSFSVDVFGNIKVFVVFFFLKGIKSRPTLGLFCFGFVASHIASFRSFGLVSKKTIRLVYLVILCYISSFQLQMAFPFYFFLVLTKLKEPSQLVFSSSWCHNIWEHCVVWGLYFLWLSKQ